MAEKPETNDRSGRITVPLSKEIEAHGEKVKHLHFREPTGADIAKCGYPVKFTDDGDFTFLAKPMSALISELGDVPPHSVASLSAADWQNCAGRVAGFFMGSGKGS